ncbi:MAG TPA: hypothetical protein VMH26_01530 [Burkholderiales bacterium]|nr:hypothetical protein [Burkholderiales bacterium]
MIRFWKTVSMGLLILMLSAGPVLAYDQEQSLREPNGSEEFVDAVVGRPLGVFAVALGAVTWVVALPFTVFSHSVVSSGEGMFIAPGKWTFTRPLGRFISCDEQPDMC